MIHRNPLLPQSQFVHIAMLVTGIMIFLLGGCISNSALRTQNGMESSPAVTLSPLVSDQGTPSSWQSAARPTVMPVQTLSPTVPTQTPANLPTKTPMQPPSATPPSASPTTQITSTAAGKTLADPSAQPQSLLVLDPIQIHSPAEDSWLLSPVELDVEFLLDDEGKIVRIELRSDLGDLLYRKIIRRDQLPIPGDRYTDQIDFEIPQESTAASLTVAMEDEPGMPLAVYTNHIRLLSSGTEKVNPPAWQAKAIDIQQPGPNATLSGGVLNVSGLTRLDAAEPLKVQLISAEGKVIGQRLAEIDVQSGAEFNPFQAQLTYKISQTAPARVIVFRSDPKSGETQYLASQSVRLMP